VEARVYVLSGRIKVIFQFPSHLNRSQTSP
jgi:hypothetical protein